MAAAMRRARGAGGARPAVRSVGCRAFLGSPENLAVVTGTTLCLVAARFGFAPTGRNLAGVGLKMEENPADDQISGDPGGLTAADVLAYGAFGHAISIAMVLGLKAQGNFPPSNPPRATSEHIAEIATAR